MLITFLTVDSPDAFVDYPELNAPPQGHVHCPHCKGHGGHNLHLNAYPLHDYPNTRSNRHFYSHFRCSCGTCSGFGYVPEEKAGIVHDWERISYSRHGDQTWRCRNTGEVINVDTSG